MLSEEAQLAMGKIGQMPVLKSLAGNAELPDYYPTFQEQLKTANARTPGPAWPKIDEAISNAVLKALRGDMRGPGRARRGGDDGRWPPGRQLIEHH